MYDAIIVGAGHNGLAAAVHLAAKGWKVAVVEQADVPGGAVKTREVTLPGFRHDLFAMNLSLFADSPFFATYKDGLIRPGLGIIAASDCFSTAFPDGTWLGVSQDLATTSRRISALSPKDADSWRAMVSAFESDAPHMFALLGSPMPSLAAAKVLWRSYRAKGGAWLGDLGRLMVASPREFLDANFDSEKLKVMMSAWAMARSPPRSERANSPALGPRAISGSFFSCWGRTWKSITVGCTVPDICYRFPESVRRTRYNRPLAYTIRRGKAHTSSA